MSVVDNGIVELKWDPNPNWWMKSVPKTRPWTDVNILRFLRLYESHKVLWCPRDPGYQNRWVKLSAYRHIARALKLQNVNEKECMKLVEKLKKRYLEDKEFHRCSKYRSTRPSWFKILDRIIKRVLTPEPKDDDSETFEACKECCAKQDLIAPCCRYGDSQDSSLQDCKACCAQQDLPSPCRFYQEKHDDDDFQACEHCCGQQNLEPPCHHYTGEEVPKPSKKEDTCSKLAEPPKRIAGPKLVQLTFDKSEFKKGSESDCGCRNCSGSDSSASHSESGDNNIMCDICNKADGSGSCSSAYSEGSFCIQDFSIYQVDDTQCEQQSDVKSESDEIKSDEKTGLFMDSSRFRGKPINLDNKYVRDDFDGRTEIIESRRHFATSSDNESHIYPLQLQL